MDANGLLSRFMHVRTYVHIGVNPPAHVIVKYVLTEVQGLKP